MKNIKHQKRCEWLREERHQHFTETLFWKALTGESHKKHQHTRQWFNIALGVQSGNSYPRHLEGTWSWQRLTANSLTPVKFVLKLCFEKSKGGMPQEYQEGREYFIKCVRVGY